MKSRRDSANKGSMDNVRLNENWEVSDVMAQSYFEYGTVEMNQREYQAAVFMFKKGLALKDVDEGIIFHLEEGIADAKKMASFFNEKYENAKKEVGRKHASIHFTAGEKLLFRLRFNEAVQQIHIASTKDPENDHYREVLAKARQDQKDFKQRTYALQEVRLREARGEHIPNNIQQILQRTQHLAPKKKEDPRIKKRQPSPLFQPTGMQESKSHMKSRKGQSSSWLCF